MIARLIGAASLFVAASLMPGTASAYELHTEGGLCPSGIRWPANPHVSVNTSNTTDPQQASQLFTAVSDISLRISNVGGQSFNYVEPYDIETSPYSFPNTGNPNGNGINEIGLADLSGTGGLGFGPTDVVNCVIVEADVYLDSNASWGFFAPSDGRPVDNCTSEDCYFDAEKKYCSNGGKRATCPNGPWTFWARPVLLHEMGHTLGIAHSDSSYSFMNYVVRPWTNRSDEKRIESLPDDREALRFLYPNASTEKDAAVTVTWYKRDVNDNPTNPGDEAADALLLCRPSTGVAFSNNIFSKYCGVDAAGNAGSTDVCPGDVLYVRYTMANYGTEALTVDQRLWFSTSTWLNTTAGADKQSPSTPAPKVLLPQRSYRIGIGFKVPNTVSYDTNYYPIIFIDSGADYASEESQQNNWIPLRSTIHVKSAANCP